jgi:hypothetical protein
MSFAPFIYIGWSTHLFFLQELFFLPYQIKAIRRCHVSTQISKKLIQPSSPNTPPSCAVSGVQDLPETTAVSEEVGTVCAWRQAGQQLDASCRARTALALASTPL